MSGIAPLIGSQNSDPKLVKQWAAEDIAIAMGLLRECPYHGQPFKAQRAPLSSKALISSFIDPLDPSVRVFNGDTREMLSTVERVTGRYGERCPMCVASEQEEFD